jgi:ssDNA-binding Zn-finger/Zn-ribbon topoisomerase 1
METPTKMCIKCKEFRLLTEYSKNKYGKDGLFWVCNYCLKEYYINNTKPVKCECGRLINEKYLKTHIKSNIHKKYLTCYSEIKESKILHDSVIVNETV